MALPVQEVLEDPEVLRGLTQNPSSFRFPDGALVTVASVHWRPHTVLTTDAEGRRAVAGPMGNMLTVLAHTLNFTYNVVTPPDGAFGGQRPNGSWTGMMGQVTSKEVDLALGPFGIIYSRAMAVDFSESFFYDARSILSMKGTPEINPWGFLFPLTGTVWGAMAVALGMVWLATLLVGRRPGASVSLRWAGEMFLQNVRVFLNQGLADVVLGQGGLMVLLSWMVVAALVFWSYKGALISLLAVRHIPQPIQTLRDLLDDHTITLVMHPMTVFTDTAAKMKSGELRELHELQFVGRIRYEPPSAYPELLETVVRTDRHSLQSTNFPLDLLIADDFLKTKRCDFYKTRQTFFATTHCMIGQKGSPLIPAINHRVRAVVESGLYVHWLMNEVSAIIYCRYTPSIITVREPLSLANLWGMVVLLGVGLLLAGGAFCLEMCVPPKKRIIR
ncbi:glutamate receptor ionotropic, delta-1-like [Scylla paramamosain]|uniref:glutamate receptor ionotropic, delta-1-like n=1 Tax=Scylla paramamosain TaxID=85552 RepID=UPI0030832A98